MSFYLLAFVGTDKVPIKTNGTKASSAFVVTDKVMKGRNFIKNFVFNKIGCFGTNLTKLLTLLVVKFSRRKNLLVRTNTLLPPLSKVWAWPKLRFVPKKQTLRISIQNFVFNLERKNLYYDSKQSFIY